MRSFILLIISYFLLQGCQDPAPVEEKRAAEPVVVEKDTLVLKEGFEPAWLQEQVPSIYDGKEKLSSEELRKKIRGEDHKIEGVKNLHIHKSDGTIDMIVALVDQAVVRDSSQLFQLLSNIVISYKQRLDGVVYLVSSARLAEDFFKDDAIFTGIHILQSIASITWRHGTPTAIVLYFFQMVTEEQLASNYQQKQKRLKLILIYKNREAARNKNS